VFADPRTAFLGTWRLVHSVEFGRAPPAQSGHQCTVGPGDCRRTRLRAGAGAGSVEDFEFL
jgi:hypothetical protein